MEMGRSEKMEIGPEEFKNLKRDLALKGRLVFELQGKSMAPLMKEGDSVTVEHLGSYKHLQLFDIIVFFDGKRLICHYFWKRSVFEDEKGRRPIMTRPLNPLRGKDTPFNEECILGIVLNYKIGLWMKLRIIVRKLCDICLTR